MATAQTLTAGDQRRAVEAVAAREPSPFPGDDQAAHHDEKEKGPGLVDRGADRERGEHDGRGNADRQFGLSASFALAAVVGNRSRPRHAVDLADVPPKRRLRR